MNVVPVLVLVESQSRTGQHRLNQHPSSKEKIRESGSVPWRREQGELEGWLRARILGLDSPGFSPASVIYQQNHVWEAFGTGHVASFCR